MSEKENAAMIPYYVHEGEMNRMERLNKRWFIAFLIAIIMLFVTNAGWIIYENQFETYYYSQEAQSESGDAAALLTTGEGSVTFNGNTSETGSENPGQEGNGEQAMPDL